MAWRGTERSVVASSVFVCLLFAAWSAAHAERCNPALGRIVSLQGNVEVETAAARMPAALEMQLCLGDAVHVGPYSRAAIQLLEAETVLRLDQNTTSRFDVPATPERSFLQLLRGAMHFLSRVPRALEVRTPYVNAGIEGTEFLVAVDADRRQTRIVVYEGTVSAENAQGKLVLQQYQSAVAGADQAPTLEAVVRSRDAVNWTLYYQPVLAALAGSGPPAAAATMQQLQAALATGGVAAALAVLDGLPPSRRSDATEVWRAALLMQVGRWQEARTTLEDLLRTGSAGAEAHALLSVLYVTQNEPPRALAEAMKAVDLDPENAAAYMALSYAQQARFDLEAARQSLLKAVEVAPGNALAWARLSELWLAGGYRDRALEAAEKAVALAPETARAHSVLGFAALARIDLDTATAEFEKAIQIASDDPLPRFGLGLAKIRGGKLAEGRREIEVAAALASNSALLRSYLGKAYFEEKRAPLDARQFALAQQLDPNDPTGFFYDAIRLQSENRPVEALRQIERAIALNDNRAVYRSRQLLDEDNAARSAALARIYLDLGFDQLALAQGWKSLGQSPGDYSAHRFLADTYATLPRHQIARVSELLQSQLRQPINATPIQPELSASDLSILQGAGPSQSSFNEYNALFERNRIAIEGHGVVGSNDTIGSDLIVGSVVGPVAFSASRFGYETDGFRSNNDMTREIYNAFFQGKIGDDTSIQAEIRVDDFGRGDLPLRFDPDNFSSTLRQDDYNRRIRLGAHHVFSPNSDLIGHLSLNNHEASAEFPGFQNVTIEDDSYTAELQHIYRIGGLQLVTGAGRVEIDRTTTSTIFIFPIPPSVTPSNIEHDNAYLYAHLNLFQDMVLTLGLSGDLFDGTSVDRDQLNPKFGLVWTPFPSTTLRAATFRTLTRTLPADQTIEPTQVAGFNQFFDDLAGTDAWRYGVGIDQRIFPGLNVGAEFSLRDLNVSATDLTVMPAVNERTTFHEQLGRGYIYWTPRSWLALRAEYQYENFERGDRFTGPEDFSDLTTHRYTLGASFFHPIGLTAGFDATYVDQSGKFGSAFGIGSVEPGSDQFWVVDAAINYRLPKRYGMVSLVARNIFDEVFKYQDTDPKSPRFSPEQQIFLKMKLFF